SRGRTIQEMIIGTILYGTIGSVLFFGIMGNYGLHLQLSGAFDVIGYMNETSPQAAIIAILDQLPMAGIMVTLFTILAIVFLATTFDSSSYILAAVVQRKVQKEPLRWNRLFWAFTLCLMPLVLMYVGDLQTLQTASIVAGFPVLFIMGLLAWSFMPASNAAIRATKDYQPPTIHIDQKEKRKK